MNPMVKNDSLNLERHELRFQDIRTNLIKSMRHWQLWAAEYEGLKEEILSATSSLTRNELVAICSQYEGDLVSKKEINDILGASRPRDTPQVVNVLDRRIDYVEQNIITLQKQIEAVDKKLAALCAINTIGVRDDEGLPFTEIIEELDENDNVISSHISTPATSTSQIGDKLQEPGLLTSTTSQIQTINFSEDQDIPQEVKKSGASDPKRSVSFTEDTKLGPDLEMSNTAKRLEEIMKLARKQEELPLEPPIIPENESAEDSALRRDMLQYGMSEVGAVVAELELEEDESTWSSDDNPDDFSDSDMEDAYGRYTGQVVTEDLRQHMAKIEQRLGAKSFPDFKQKTDDYDIVEEGIGRITISHKEAEETVAAKTVRFADKLDIASGQAPQPISGTKTVSNSRIDPVGDIVERSTYSNNINHSHRQGSASTKADINLKRTIPEGPPGIPLAETIIEHDSLTDVPAIEPEEIDPHLLQQEIATEYYRMRNIMIQRQGGFMKENESERVEFTEEEGGPKKISRFKAARLARS
ncbi:hypothetical protein K3495_g8349 [Podosphaera aphanis]|nr:hypothetical protein K3495_g8349 [Podosphaera aphanis]